MKKFINILYSFTLIFFFIAFGFQHNPPKGWYQQFMPDLGSLSLRDITFVDSLTGYAVASKFVNPDTSMILKTGNGGDNWSIIHHQGSRRFTRIIFLDETTGYISGGTGSGTPYLFKTTDGGSVWNTVSVPGINLIDDISILNEDTIWIVDDNGFNGGIFRTTNGGNIWEQQFGGLGGNKPDKIYMYDGKFGFAGSTSLPVLLRTTNSGLNWTQVPGENGFRDIYFADSLIGWKCLDSMRKTTDGGLTWQRQYIPYGGNISNFGGMVRFVNINKDTIWGSGGYIQYSQNYNRGFLYFTSNGGENWLYQIPDTSFGVSQFSRISFINKDIGWSYLSAKGIHTTTGGDTTFLTNIKNSNSEQPVSFQLYQNYPNPFNPVTKIKFDIPKAGEVQLIIYDILGRKVSTLVNEKLSVGSYEYTFDAGVFPSGIYFYSLISDKTTFTKKMLLAK